MSSTNTIGKYQIIREIARSNDIVYEAVDPTLGRTVALKELNLPPNLAGAQKRERIERFLREGKAAGQLAHPNIVTVYDVGQEGDRFYIAMEFLGGQTLRDVIQMKGALPVKEAVDITLQLCSALAYAHQHNVVHRDVKPENVQILAGGHVKLTDFGIARIMSEPSITANGQVFGTPSYMSPEQVSGKGVDNRSDIFAVGVMLYEMLAGQKPFSGDTVVTITYNIMNSEPPAPPGVPQHLMGIVRKAMSKDPSMRYQNIEQMIDELKMDPPPNSAFLGDPFAVPAPGSYSPQYGGSSRPPSGTTYQPSPGYSPAPASAQNIPDPFAAPAPPHQVQYNPPVSGPPPAPPTPIMSAETRTFFAVLLLVVGLAGLIIAAVWAVNMAYTSYADSAAVETATRYLTQGDKLMQEGKMDAALDQYSNAKRAAGTTKASKEVRKRLAITYAEFARKALLQNAYPTMTAYAKQAVEADPTLSAGQYYLGLGSYYAGDQQTTESALKTAIEKGGNDDFGKAARRLLSQFYIAQGDNLKAAGNTSEAKNKFQQAVDLQDEDYATKAQEKLNELGS